MNKHILERDYEFSQAPGPGQLITNLYPNPDLSIKGPYAMCGKCHDLNNVCPMGVGTSTASTSIPVSPARFAILPTAWERRSGTISGERLVNFDVNVVAPNGGIPVSYSRATNTCVLVCHSAAHNPDGTVTQGAQKNPKAGGPNNGGGVHRRELSLAAGCPG